MYFKNANKVFSTCWFFSSLPLPLWKCLSNGILRWVRYSPDIMSEGVVSCCPAAILKQGGCGRYSGLKANRIGHPRQAETINHCNNKSEWGKAPETSYFQNNSGSLQYIWISFAHQTLTWIRKNDIIMKISLGSKVIPAQGKYPSAPAILWYGYVVPVGVQNW